MFDVFKKIKRKKFEWKPIPHFVIKDDVLRAQLHKEGFAVVEMFDVDTIVQLKELYKSLHNLDKEGGGMFYSLYSTDIGYRLKINEGISTIIHSNLDKYLTDYRNIINFFITKIPGPNSELNIHQDMTSLDEKLYSPLSIWIPLQEINEKNGALCIVPRSHFMFSPYRSISFQTPYQNITKEIIPFLRPVYLKLGQVIVFDPRVLHHSLPNQSEEHRIAVVCGIFPKEAQIITCFKEHHPKAKIELLLQPDDFLITNKNFYNHCTDRPDTGELISYAEDEMQPIEGKEFIKQCELIGIQPYEGAIPFLNRNCQMIDEPITAL